VIAVVTIFGLVVDPTNLAADVEEITKRAPNSFGAVLASQAQQVAAADAGSLSLGLTVSLVVTLWSVSSGGYALFRAIRQAYDLPPQNYVVARARAFGSAIGAVLALGILLGGGALLLSWRDTQSQTVRTSLTIAGAVALAVGFTLLVVWTFRFSIAERAPMRSLLPGAVIGTCVTLALLIGVTVFGSYMVNYQAIYGALTGVIVTLLAGYTIMYVLLLCAVFNQQWQPLPTAIVGQVELFE
jgi:membrane protein